ncbi:MAG: hypothetical protein V1813_03715 [Candidatus Aenigmatarchaeota archaeon]
MVFKIQLHGTSSGGHFFKKYEVELDASTPEEERNGMVSSLRNYLKGHITNGELTSGKILIDYNRLNGNHNNKPKNEGYCGLDTDNV